MTLDSFNAFTVTVTPQSVLWKFFWYGVIFLIVCKHFGPRSSPTSVGSRLCPNYLWECFVVSAKVVATYSMGGSSKQSGTVSGATLCRVWLGSKLFVFFYRSLYSNPGDQAQSRLLSVWSYFWFIVKTDWGQFSSNFCRVWANPKLFIEGW